MKVFAAYILISLLDMVPMGQAFLKPLQQRDSILVADQVEYGFALEGVKQGETLSLMDFSALPKDTLEMVRDWRVDTLKTSKKEKTVDISASVVLAPFEPGEYHLPPIYVRRVSQFSIDTLVFDPQVLEVKTMPVDTNTFEIKDLKGQINYPVTFSEIAPYIGGGILLAGLIALTVYLLRKFRRKKVAQEHVDPPHIVALRELDKYRSDKFWAADRQKSFYSGVTDALKAYIDSRFGVDAPEMTTAELFAALKGEQDLTPEQYADLKALFERADFVKFAKYVASDEENAKVLPCAVSFVTTTYEQEVEAEAQKNGEEADGE